MEKQLPINWINVFLQDVTKNVKGKKPKIQSEVEFEGSIPYMDIKALEYNEIRQYADIESSKLFEERDIAMVWDGARSGWVSKTNFGAIGSTIVALKPIKFSSEYLYYYLLDKYPYINSNARGVGIPHVDPTVLWNLKFPLPPLAEQNRIVAKLDALFAQLETIKTSMAKVPLLLKDFRQQVLTQAVTGKLTEEWRKGKNLDIWINFKINEVVKFIGGGTPSKSNKNYWNGDIPWASVKDFKDYNRLEETQDFITNLGLKNSSSNLAKKGDLLLITRMSPGKTIITNIDTAINQDLKIVKPKIDINLKFLLYWFNVKRDYIESISTGTTVKGIRIELLNIIDIVLPSYIEQQEIVSRVESLFAKADAIEKQYEILKAKIESLPQAILNKAFKGELTEQLDSDGDARELLKEIKSLLAEQSNIKKKGKKVKV